ncbi:MAG: prepilin-type N-terminal cleavage/methylation domain-containing protein [Clostridia bacterium]|nr:prepilin-type N-terminal cleavage/methylation domain-containing protein [Clostridia bacterium]
MTENKVKKGGFTMVEVVIALAVVVIVSVTAIAIVSSSITAGIVSENKTRAQNFAESAWEAFKVSANNEDFEKNLEFAGGVDVTYSSENDTYTYTYTSEKYKFTATITVNFTASPKQFKVVAVDNDGDEIISLSYEKN